MIDGIQPSLRSSDNTILTVDQSGTGHTGSRSGTAVVTASIQRLTGHDTLLLSSTATVVATDTATHTPGDTSILAHLPLAGGPLGVVVASAGVGFVTLDQVAQVARLDLAAPHQTAAISVGDVPSYIAATSGGAQIFVANQWSDNVGVIDPISNTQSTMIPVVGDPLPVAVSVHDNVLFTTTNANNLYKIDIATRTVSGSLALPATSHHLLVHPNDTLVYVATRDGGSVLEVNWRTMTVARTFVLGNRPQGMALSPDRQELYVANELGNVVHVINLTTGSVAANIPLAGGGEGLSLNVDGSKLYVGLVFSGSVQVIDRATRAVLKTINTGGRPREIAVDAPRQRMIVVNEAGWVDFLR